MTDSGHLDGEPARGMGVSTWAASRTSAFVCVCVSLLLSSHQAWADSADVVRAETLFQHGKALYQEGRHDEACPQLEESQRLDPAGGTLLLLALCYEALGLHASAWATYLKAQASAERDGRDDRLEIARRRAQRLEPVLAYVTIRVVEPLPSDQVITQDGQAVATLALGVRTPIDPGRHLLEASRRGQRYWSSEINVVPGKSLEIDVPEANPASDTLPVEKKQSAGGSHVRPIERAEPTDVSPIPTPREPQGEPNSTPYLAYALTGAGGVALGLGSYFGIRAWRDVATIRDECPNGEPCDPRFEPTQRRAENSARLANWLVPIGALSVGSGVYLFTRAWNHSEHSVLLHLSPTQASLSVTGDL